MIHRIQVKNFKSIRDVILDLSPITVLAGINGTGKSNFLDSMGLLREILVSGDFQRSDWAALYPARSIATAHPSFTVAFSSNLMPGMFIYQLTFHRLAENEPSDPPSLVSEFLMHNGRTVFHHADGQWVQKPELTAPPEPGHIVLGTMPTIIETVAAFNSLTTAISYLNISKSVFKEKLDDRIPANSDSCSEAANLIGMLKRLIDNVPKLKLRNNMLAALQRWNPSIESISTERIVAPKKILIGHKIGKRTLELDIGFESFGFRKFFALLLALNQCPPKEVLTFDSPEDGLDSIALGVLADEIKAANQDGRGQIVLATHSDALLNHFATDQVRLVELDGFETKISPYNSVLSPAVISDGIQAIDSTVPGSLGI